ncbi:MAG: alpha-galactosidase [Christensenellaceae bacterium]
MGRHCVCKCCADILIEIHPFLGLLEQDCEEKGVCYGVQLIAQRQFCAYGGRNSFGTVRLSGGINDEQFCWEVRSGESFVTPQGSVLFGTGARRSCRGYADLIRERIMNPRLPFAPRPIVINNWEATYFL